MAQLFHAAVAQAKSELKAELAELGPPVLPQPISGVPAGRGGRPPQVLRDFDPRDRICYTIAQAAAATGVSERTIWNRVEAGELWTFKWGGRTLILADVLKEAVVRSAMAQKPGAAA